MDSGARVTVLEVVSANALRGYVVPPRADGRPAFLGSGSIDFICGACLGLLASGVTADMFGDLVFQCRCGAWNRVHAGDAVFARVEAKPTGGFRRR